MCAYRWWWCGIMHRKKREKGAGLQGSSPRDPAGVAPGRGVHLDPPELEFEAVLDPGPAPTRSVVLRNTGAEAVTLGAVQVEGAPEPALGSAKPSLLGFRSPVTCPS